MIKKSFGIGVLLIAFGHSSSIALENTIITSTEQDSAVIEISELEQKSAQDVISDACSQGLNNLVVRAKIVKDTQIESSIRQLTSAEKDQVIEFIATIKK